MVRTVRVFPDRVTHRHTDGVKPSLTTQQVVLTLGLSLILATTIIILAVLKADIAAILGSVASVMVFVAGAFGLSKVNALTKDVGEVKDLSNGRVDRLLARLDEQHDKTVALALAAATPVVEPAPTIMEASPGQPGKP